MSKLVGWLVLSSLLLALSFNTAWTGWLSFVALIPLFIFIEKAQAEDWSSTRITKYVWLAGLGFNLIILFWLAQLQLEIVPTKLAAGFTLIKVFIWVITALVGSLGALFTIFFVNKLRLDLYKPSSLIYIPALWTVGELIRSYVCSLIWWNPEASVGTFWNFGALGVAAGSTPLGHLAGLVGLYGLGFIVVMVNIMIFWLIRKRNDHLAYIVLGSLLLVNISMYAIYAKPSGPTINTGFIQQKQFDTLNTDRFRLAISNSHSKGDYDLFVLPEYTKYFMNPNGKVQEQVFDKLFTGGRGVLISAGGPDVKNDRNTSQIVYRNQDMRVISVQEKNFLMPIGEYVPTGAENIIRLAGKQSIIDAYKQNRKILEKGDNPEKPVYYNGVSYGTLACSGSLTPQPFRNLAGKGAEILVSSSSLGTLDQSPLFNIQSEQMIRFTAIATSRPYIQSSKGGYSYVVDHNGKIIIKNPADSLELVSSKIEANAKKTPYVKFGDIGVPVSIVAVIYLFVTRRLLTFSDRKNSSIEH